MFSFTENRRFLFVHIPKTAGTSFRQMICKKFREKHIVNNRRDLKLNNGRYIPLRRVVNMRERLRDCRLLVGHLPFAARELMGTDINVMVFLRDPMSRAISNIRQVQSIEKPHLSVREVVELPGELNRIVTNLQTRYLSFSSVEEAVEGYRETRIDRERLETAKSNLRECSFVGITEDFRQSVKLCEKTFGWRFFRYNVVSNVSQDTGEDLRWLHERLAQEIKYDIELYEYGKALFAERLASFEL